MESRMTPGFWFEFVNAVPCTVKGNRKGSRLRLREIVIS